MGREIESRQGSQIFLGAAYQNGKNIPNGRKIYQMATKYTKWPQDIPTSPIVRFSRIYPNWDFWFENTPSGNPGV
jgi:hypothetical protein